MKKSSLTSIVLALFVTFMFCACGDGGGEKGKTPADITMELWIHIQQGDFQKAAEFWYDNAAFGKDGPMGGSKEMAINMIANLFKSWSAERGKIDKVELPEEDINEEFGRAWASVLVIYEDGKQRREEVVYRKVDGVWKINAGNE